jgi:hypothetical protein
MRSCPVIRLFRRHIDRAMKPTGLCEGAGERPGRSAGVRRCSEPAERSYNQNLWMLDRCEGATYLPH